MEMVNTCHVPENIFSIMNASQIGNALSARNEGEDLSLLISDLNHVSPILIDYFVIFCIPCNLSIQNEVITHEPQHLLQKIR